MQGKKSEGKTDVGTNVKPLQNANRVSRGTRVRRLSLCQLYLGFRYKINTNYLCKIIISGWSPLATILPVYISSRVFPSTKQNKIE